MSMQPALVNNVTNDAEWLQLLDDNGYRLTKPRRVVVEVLVASNRALTPVEIYDLARQQYAKLGLTTVYRTLEKLARLGLVQRIHQSEGCHAYVPAPTGHKHLLICEDCRQTQYFVGDHLDGLMSQVATESGFQVKGHLLQFLGVCSDCQ